MYHLYRFYTVLLTIAITTLIVYTILGSQTQSITIRNRSQTVYEDLLNKYPTTLSYQCSQIDISYGAFISVSVQYHPICSSFFVSGIWINMIFNQNIGYYIQIDFRSSASDQFQLISSLCSLAQETVHNALDDFLSDTFFTINILSSVSLETQSQAQSSFVRASTVNAVRGILRLIRDTTSSNQLQPALETTRMNALYIYPDGQLASGILDGYFLTDNTNL